jgi:hypothetical protein
LSPFSVADLVHLVEFATRANQWKPMMKSFDGPNVHSCVDITFLLMLQDTKLS